MQQALENPNLWNDAAQAQSLGKERAQLQRDVERFEKIERNLNDTRELFELALADGDESVVTATEKDLIPLAKHVEDLEFQRMFDGEMDPNNAFLDIQSGSGGTEAQDWAEMLLRMYQRRAEEKGF